ncbi:MAG: hypothetical protein ACREP9_11510 [Candidatus Dormibacteraceae bacterium]
MGDVVAELRELLGANVVFVACPLGSKAADRKWGHLTVRDMDAAYLAKLDKGNIAVRLGETSAGLCTIDGDNDPLVRAFEAANPELKHTLQSWARRGRNFWLRIKGEYPGTTVLVDHSRKSLGEFRASGAYTIIHGKHPDGLSYQHNGHKPVEIEFMDIKWPTTIANPPQIERRPPPHPYTTSVSSDSSASSASSGSSGSSVQKSEFFSSVASIEDALRLSVPTAAHQSNHNLFVLARAVKTLEMQQASFQPAQLLSIFDRWHGRAKPFLRV